MLAFGIDVVLLIAVAFLCVMAAFVMSLMLPLDHDMGWACVISTSITSVVMVVGYIVIATLLDLAMGTYGW